MITKEEFITLIKDFKKWDNKIDQVCKILNIDIIESDLIMYCSILFEKTISFLFEEEAQDNIFWWLWEKNGRPDMKMFDKDSNEVPTETLDDLWEIVKDNRK